MLSPPISPFLWVTLSSQGTEPGRRYASAEEFSKDIERHLSGLPIKARKTYSSLGTKPNTCGNSLQEGLQQESRTRVSCRT